MNYKEVIEALHKKRLDAEAGGGGGGAGAGGGAAGGSGGASAGGSATGSSGDGGSADGGSTGDSGTTSTADSTSSEPTTSRGGFFVGYGGYWSPPGKKKKKKKKKAKVGSVKDGIYEGDVIDAKDKFGKPAPEIKVMAKITLPNKQTDWFPAYSGKDLAFAKDKANRLINPIQQGVTPLSPEDVKISVDGKYIAIPELQITENMLKKVAGVGILTALLGAGANAFLNKLPDQQAQPDVSTKQSYHQDIKDRTRSVSDRAREIAYEMGIIKDPNNARLEFRSVGGVPVEINGIEVPAVFLTDKEVEKIKNVEQFKAMMKDANSSSYHKKRSLPESATVEQLEDKLYKLEGALGMARDITRDIKYVDTHIEIISKLSGVAEDVGLELDKYDESKVLELKNELESAIYQLEEPFEDAIRDIQNKIDELEYEDD